MELGTCGVKNQNMSPLHDRWMPRNGERYFLRLGNGTIQRLRWYGTDFDPGKPGLR